MSILTKNNAIEFMPSHDQDQGHFRVCKNYIMSVQHIREEFRRENTLAYRYYCQPHPVDQPLQKQLNYLACSTVSACANELEANMSGAKLHSKETKELAASKGAHL